MDREIKIAVAVGVLCLVLLAFAGCSQHGCQLDGFNCPQKWDHMLRNFP